MPADPSACLTCGACCCHYRVSFYWQEAEQRGLEDKDLVQVTPLRVCFRGMGPPRRPVGHVTGGGGSRAMCSQLQPLPTPIRVSSSVLFLLFGGGGLNLGYNCGWR